MTAQQLVYYTILLAGAGWTGAAAACTVSATPMVFGSVDPLAGTPTDSAANISVTCPALTSHVIAITGGNGPVNSRRMVSATGELGYQLYTDAGLNYVWGDGTGGTATVSGGSETTQTQYTVHGRIPSQPLAKAGQYSDVVIITVSY